MHTLNIVLYVCAIIGGIAFIIEEVKPIRTLQWIVSTVFGAFIGIAVAVVVLLASGQPLK